MFLINKIYYWLRRKIYKSGEKNKYSEGYWPERVRCEALSLCRGISGSILEVGCGKGLFLIQLANKTTGLEIWGIDNDQARLSCAEKKIKDGDFKNIKLSLQNATNMPFENEYFDNIICINVFYNMASLELVRKSLSEIKRVCKKSGKIIFDFRNSLNFPLRIRYRLARYHDKTIEDLPLKTYSLKQIENILNKLGFIITKRIFIGFPFNLFSPIIIIEAKNV